MKKLYVNDLFCPSHLNTVATLPCEMQSHILAVYNSEFILGSTCVGLQNHCETTKALKICWVRHVECASGASLPHQNLGCRRTETTHQRRVGCSESRGYWTCCWLVASTSTRLHSCWRRTFWVHAVVKMMWCDFLRDNNCQLCLSLFS